MIENKSKIIVNKEDKKNRIMNSAFSLFTDKGVKNTSIQDIVDNAGVAKGTFYLYFKDKDDLEEYLITSKSEELFLDAIRYVDEKKIVDFSDRLINVIDYIIDILVKDKMLLKFISKNLSLGMFGDRVSNIVDNSTMEVLERFKKSIKDNNIKIENPEITLFMIIELTSSVVFTSIMLNKPLPIDELKPFLFKKIRSLLLD